MIFFVFGCKQVVFVGDYKQFGFVIMNKKVVKVGFNQFLFERLVKFNLVFIWFNVQYCMYFCFLEFFFNMFYEGLFQNGVIIIEWFCKDVDFFWFVVEILMMFWFNLGNEEILVFGIFYLNCIEVFNVEKIVICFFKVGVKLFDIGVIILYEGQCSYIVSIMQNMGIFKKESYKEVEVVLVDVFQGCEKDFIVFFCVCFNDNQGIGFLFDFCCFNVVFI